MAHELPDLGYAYDALEPHIDARTMEIHHSKHHNAYVTNLNAAIDGTALADKSICELVMNLGEVPEEIRGAVRNNGGGHFNHTFFWECIKPGGAGEPSAEIADCTRVTALQRSDLWTSRDRNGSTITDKLSFVVAGRRRNLPVHRR